MRTRFRLLTLLSLVAALTGCRDQAAENPTSRTGAGDTLIVASAVEPLAWLGCRVLGEPCKMVSLLPSTGHSHDHSLRPSMLRNLSGAHLFLASGVAGESRTREQMQTIAPGLVWFEVADLAGSDGLWMGNSHDAPFDPHVWLSPRTMRTVALALADSLVLVQPEWALRMARGSALLLDTLAKVESDLDSLARECPRRLLISDHDAFGYLARDLGWSVESLTKEGSSLGPKAIRTARSADGIRTLWTVQLHPDAALRALAEKTGLRVVPLSVRPAPWTIGMRSIGAALREDCLAGG